METARAWKLPSKPRRIGSLISGLLLVERLAGGGGNPLVVLKPRREESVWRALRLASRGLHSRGALDRVEHVVVRAAAAQIPGDRLPDLEPRGFRVFVQEALAG